MIGNPAEDDGNMDTNSKSQRAQLVQEVADHFWKRWASEVTPIHIIRQQWQEKQRNLKVGDLVLVHYSNKLRKKYTLAVVTDVHTSQDGMVSSCTVGFSQSRSPTKKLKDRSVWQALQHSVQRLTLLLPVEEQVKVLEVTDGVVSRAQIGSISRGQPTNPAHGHSAIPARDSRRALSDEIKWDICPENQDDDGKGQSI